MKKLETNSYLLESANDCDKPGIEDYSGCTDEILQCADGQITALLDYILRHDHALESTKESFRKNHSKLQDSFNYTDDDLRESEEDIQRLLDHALHFDKENGI